ncbi:methylation-associated defense system DNA methyltransferase MAD2 [Mucilaginibacter lappiensis]|uniref:methylation-associated defense system DNA methyltransferase MAD2 n=1 Tax=Mucilaginibacter lappiensis TaxID=354630 RepID=UPI003D207DCC
MNEKALIQDNNISDDIILGDGQLVCVLTGEVKMTSGKEIILQSVARMLNEEYGFDISDMEREFTITGYDPDSGKQKKQKIDIVIFEKDLTHRQSNIIRLCIVQDEKTKENDKKKGVEILLQNALSSVDGCEFGLWTNGATYNFLQKEVDAFDNLHFADLSDFPGEGQTIADLDRSDKIIARNPANDSLIRVFKRCHDYIYGNEGMKKTAFWELLNLIFCKIYDEKRRFTCAENGESYRREFWVGVKEQNTQEGRERVAKRIKSIFEKLRKDEIFSEVFDGNEQINLTEKGLAFIAAELSKYSFLEATVDVKGVAYETIVSNTLKQEAGQFFTPRNIVKCMVSMMDPNENQRVLDPACGSGGFLVMVLDHVRRKFAKQLFPDLDGAWLEEKFNSLEVNNLVKDYAEQYLFGFDFDPDLKKAARMNMVMAGDGHANIFHANSLAYPNGDNETEIKKINDAVLKSINNGYDASFPFDQHYNALGKFDLIFTNPPFGAKIPINDVEILKQYDLGHNWKKNNNGQWQKVGISGSEPPEILFIDQCYQFLKPGGKMAIVLPDGILGNPNTEYVRSWILDKFRLLASIDLAVEAFLPQVGVQASLLFLQKKTEEERSLALINNENYDVFMAIAEKLGKDRRGNQIYLRDDEGAELLFDEVKSYLTFNKKEGKILKERKEKQKRLDDDLPLIAAAYKSFLNKEV